MHLNVLYILIAFFFLPLGLSAQCDSSAIEIPNNGIDEDCDGLDDLYLIMPPHVYLLENQDFDFYFRNVFLSTHPQDYICEVTTDLVGTAAPDHWEFTPNIQDVGEHPLTFSIKAPDGTPLAEATTILRIAPYHTSDTQTPHSIFLLGHSFIDQGYMPAYISDLTEQVGNPPISYHGSRASWIDGTKHEALGGASWEYYYQNPASPFLFDSAFDIRSYFDSFLCVDCTPDWFVIHLDVNDFCFPGLISGDDMQFIDDYIDTSYVHFIEPFINELRYAAPQTKIAISFTPPPNGRDSTFINFFGAASVLSDRYRWQKIVSRITHKYTAYFAGREAENIWLLPIQLDIDDVVDFSPIDPVHPHPDVNTLEPPSGYLEIAKETFAWMKYTMNGTVGTKNAAITESTWRVFPNPAQDMLYVESSFDDVGIKSVQVLSLLGNNLQDIFVDGNSISIRNLEGGSYFVRLILNNGVQYTTKFIKLR